MLHQATDDVSKNLQHIKAILHGDTGPLKMCSLPVKRHPDIHLSTSHTAEGTPELTAQLAQEFYNNDLLYLLLSHISRFEFEARKDVVQIFNNLLRRQIGSRWPTVDHIAGRPDIVFAALAGYENEEVALNTGMILKEMLRHEQLCKILLYSDR
jgi:calcium binding protein 39